ncbi:MAG: hypothetical protein JWQ81_4648 [Amycolatopsis sp.]|jgi:hypothetical protein|nr:hypothetical protein [Amycolatopsis sp.]
MAPQLDELCWFCPELRIFFAPRTEPWEDLVVELMLE